MTSTEKERAIQRTVDRVMRQCDGVIADRERKFQTDALLDDADPDQIDAACDAFVPIVVAWRRDYEAELTNFLRGLA